MDDLWSIGPRITSRGPSRASPRIPSGSDLPGSPPTASGACARTRASSRRARCPRPSRSTRKQWIDANLSGMKDLVEPLSGKLRDGLAGLGPLSGPARVAAGFVLAGEVGVLLGFLAQRVLGQYELALLDPTTPAAAAVRAPNLDDAAQRVRCRRARVPPLGRAARGHARGPVRRRAVAAAAYRRAGARAARRRSSVAVDLKRALRLPERRRSARDSSRPSREGDLVSRRRQARASARSLDRMQATMAVLEGYAEHVMDAVGARRRCRRSTSCARRSSAGAASRRRRRRAARAAARAWR